MGRLNSMRKTKLAAILVISCISILGMATMVFAANPDDYKLVRYLYTFDTEEELIGWSSAGKTQEFALNTDPKFVKVGKGSLAFRVEFPAGGNNWADMRLNFTEEFGDWSGAKYIGFWLYIPDVSVLDHSYGRWSTRVLMNDAGGSSIDIHFPLISDGWNFLIFDLEAVSGPKMEEAATANGWVKPDIKPTMAEALEGQKDNPVSVFYVVGKAPGDVGLMSEYVSQFIIRQPVLGEGQYNFWAYIDGIALYN
jgi:hypothetical protein